MPVLIHQNHFWLQTSVHIPVCVGVFVCVYGWLPAFCCPCFFAYFLECLQRYVCFMYAFTCASGCLLFVCVWPHACMRLCACICVCVTWGHVSAFRLHLLSPPLLLLFFFFVCEERSVVPVRAVSIHRLSFTFPPRPLPHTSVFPSLRIPSFLIFSLSSFASSPSLYLEHFFSASRGCFTWRVLLSLNCHGSHLSYIGRGTKGGGGKVKSGWKSERRTRRRWGRERKNWEEEIEREVQRMDRINERDTSLETRGCSWTEAFPRQICFLYKNDDIAFGKSK